MAIDGRLSILECEVDGTAIATRLYRDARDVAIGYGHQRFAFHAVGLDVDAGMKMARAHLAEVGRVETRHLTDGVDVVRRVEFCLRQARKGDERKD